MLRQPTAFGIMSLIGAFACQPSLRPAVEGSESAESCQANKGQLIQLLEALPEKGLAVRGRADLPIATLGGVIGGGRVVDIANDGLLLDGEALGGHTALERGEQLRTRLVGDAESSALPPGATRPLLYLAVAGATDIRALRGYLQAIPRSFDVHLVFQAPPPKGGSQAQAGASVAERLRSESDFARRHALARDAYHEFARCEPVRKAVETVGAGDPSERWPALRKALLQALPSCSCNELDTDELREVLMAEQRAGAAAVGALPFDFVRDERCGASLGLTPVQQVVKDIETFDEQFAGGYGNASLDFDQVVTNDRLLEYLCQALPGETLASLQRARHTFYWKVRGIPRCQPWQFEPLAPGSPMGSWRRVDDGAAQPLTLHYWQGAEEIRLYGPVSDAGSKPTDDRPWACAQDFRMRGIDAQSIQLENGRWFFTEAACQQATEDEAAFPGCVAALAGGPPEIPPAVPATFPALGDGQHEATP
jgi:hypothetical protein